MTPGQQYYFIKSAEQSWFRRNVVDPSRRGAAKATNYVGDLAHGGINAIAGGANEVIRHAPGIAEQGLNRAGNLASRLGSGGAGNLASRLGLGVAAKTLHGIARATLPAQRIAPQLGDQTQRSLEQMGDQAHDGMARQADRMVSGLPGPTPAAASPSWAGIPRAHVVPEPQTSSQSPPSQTDQPDDAFLRRTMGSYDPNSALDQRKAEAIRQIFQERGAVSPNQIYADPRYSQIKQASHQQTTTPGQQYYLTKTARISPTILRALSRGWQGFKRSPADMASSLAGRGAAPVPSELGRAGKVGNLLGAGTATGGGMVLLNKLFGGPEESTKTDPNMLLGPAGLHPTAEKSKFKLFNSPRDIGKGLSATARSMSPFMSGDELESLYGGSGMKHRTQAMVDPFRVSKRQQNFLQNKEASVGQQYYLTKTARARGIAGIIGKGMDATGKFFTGKGRRASGSKQLEGFKDQMQKNYVEPKFLGSPLDKRIAREANLNVMDASREASREAARGTGRRRRVVGNKLQRGSKAIDSSKGLQDIINYGASNVGVLGGMYGTNRLGQRKGRAEERVAGETLASNMYNEGLQLGHQQASHSIPQQNFLQRLSGLFSANPGTMDFETMNQMMTPQMRQRLIQQRIDFHRNNQQKG